MFLIIWAKITLLFKFGIINILKYSMELSYKNWIIYIYIYSHTHKHIYTHTHTHTHTHTYIYIYIWWWWWFSHSVGSDSLPPHELLPTRLLCPWDFPGKHTGLGCHFLLRGSSWLRDQIWVSCLAGGFLMDWAIKEALNASKLVLVKITYKYSWNNVLLIWSESLYKFERNEYFT